MAPGTPVLDGVAIPQHPFEPTAPAISRTVPVVVGYNRTEESIYYRSRPAPTDMSDEDMKSPVADRLGETPVSVDRVIEVYRTANPDAKPWELFMLICTDHPRGTYPQTLAVRREASDAAPTYLYRFDWEIDDTLMAPHALEIPFAFNNIDKPYALFDIPETPEALSLAKRMSAAWIAFARTGEPDTPDIPNWPAYTADERSTMIFDNECHVLNDPHAETRRVMEDVLGLS